MTELHPEQFSKRLNEALDMRNYPSHGRGRVNYVQEVFGISRSGANKWLHGKSIPHPKARQFIAEKLGVNLQWLEKGIGSALDQAPDQYAADMQAQQIPVLSMLQVAEYHAGNLDINLEHEDKLVVNKRFSDHCFAVHVVGSSMNPKISDGSYVIIEPKVPIEDGDYVVATVPMLPEAVCRQYVAGAAKNYLMALNQKFESIPLENNNNIIGKVVEIRTLL